MLAIISLVCAPAWAGQLDTSQVQPSVEDTAGRTWLANATLEPYGTVSWRGLDGKAVTGAGANVVSHITGGFSLWGFGESDNTAHSTIDRAGLGLRYEGHLGKRVRGDAGVALAYDFEGTAGTSHVNSADPFVFVRLPVGLTLDVFQSKNFDAGLRAAYAFDIGGNGKYGTAFGRAFIGPVANFKW